MRRQKLWIGVSAIFVASLLGLPALGQAASTLYSAASPVPDQSVEARAEAFTRNLGQVIIKVSGDPAAARYAGTLDASSLVIEYRYRQLPIKQGGGLELWTRFDAQRLTSALAAAGVPVWGENRPTVIAWVATPSGIVDDASSKPLRTTMRETAEQRGLPLVLPLLDLVDRQQVQAFDIRSFFIPTLEKASQRYEAQGMLIGSITPAPGFGGVDSSWRLVLGGRSNAFSIPAPSAQSAAAAAVGRAANVLANRFARLSTRGLESDLELVVSGIDSLKSAVVVRRAIGEVQGVKALRLYRINGAKLRFIVSYAGTSEGFARLLELSGILARNAGGFTPASAVGSVSRPTLSFRYKP